MRKRPPLCAGLRCATLMCRHAATHPDSITANPRALKRRTQRVFNQASLARARSVERKAIAREMHDTLLQSTQVLIFAFQAIARDFAQNDPRRVRMEQTLDRAEDALVEIREFVYRHRSKGRRKESLEHSLVLVAHQFCEWRRLEVNLTVEGAPRTLTRCVHEHLYRMAREAIFNAFRHSGGSRLDIDARYGADLFCISIRDDGVGLPLENPLPAAHAGLIGMHERARLIGAELQISSAVDAGVTVSISLTAALAYRTRDAKAHRAVAAEAGP